MHTLNLYPTGQNQKRNSKNFQKWPRNKLFKQAGAELCQAQDQLGLV